ncbi:hypothetical protein J3Q64DRAFT_1838550 [Phycomyces blakesleeanus]|uniref:Uncharacterized protein n=2 Tax=Phycomyces blakesleeanus TaxID=4837 RepID=A0A167PKL6_PHYB8|nr:hypothetical protein PHYBLDRAFT_164999 [Phycomyces blakesleeanus NRRL 1555(-)]OAD78127.1 hypothetical protein PHYBLDRAFT_164999 [Phycomyces blakesleeanus NRRL 1555(-)]|eukprot:XP_018296167.1 hypothetical protein PHYBLDRAFT_164999 [Phycomyces blakesleeanus NRRL 1555(-)]
METRFPKNLGGPLLSLKTRHLVDSPLTSMSKSLVPPITAHHQTKPLEEPTVQCSPPETGQRCTCLEHMCQKQLSGFSSASKGHQYQTRSDKNVSKTQWDRRQKNQWLAETGKTVGQQLHSGISAFDATP